MYKLINEIINIIINDEKTKQMEPPKISKSTAKDYHGFNQRELMKIIKGNNLNESALKLLKILSNLYNSENKELLLHRTTKIFFFKKERNNRIIFRLKKIINITGNNNGAR